jgi:glycosyltransferase involved in cell wall biosynthesis
MLLDLGHEVFSNGAYIDPKGHISLPRPGLKGAIMYPELVKLAQSYPRNKMPDEMIEPFDVIILMHCPGVLFELWPRIKHKKVIWRSIGQSVGNLEKRLQPLFAEGLKIVRYSPKEKSIPNYAGETAMIRFYKDERTYSGWIGDNKTIINFSQSLKGRRNFCHYDQIMPLIEKFDGLVYGSGNEDLESYNGGQIPFDQQIRTMRHARAMVYGGTWPAPYTLSFIEALMMGLPIVAISKKLAHLDNFEGLDFYEVDEILSTISGIVCDSPEQMIKETKRLMDDDDHAKNISVRQRKLAIELFGKPQISQQWKELLESL